MASINLRNVSVEFPLLGARSPQQEQQGDFVSDDKRINSLKALNDVSFELTSGDTLGLIGSNGSGKSTLLKTIGGIYHPSSGSISVDGKISAMFNIGLGMRQESTGRRNIVLRGLILGKRLSEINDVMESIISFSELSDHIDLPIRMYSQGMTMRLAFSIATAFEPEILLLDEWIGAGDAAFRKKAAVRMASLVKRSSITVLASHNIELLKQNCANTIWLEKGQIKALGETNEILKEYVRSRHLAKATTA